MVPEWSAEVCLLSLCLSPRSLPPLPSPLSHGRCLVSLPVCANLVQDEARELTREEEERLQHGHRQLSRSERADQAADRQMLEEMVKRSFVELGAVGFSCHAAARYVQMHAPGYGSLTLGEVELQVDELFSQWCVLDPPLRTLSGKYKNGFVMRPGCFCVDKSSSPTRIVQPGSHAILHRFAVGSGEDQAVVMLFLAAARGVTNVLQRQRRIV